MKLVWKCDMCKEIRPNEYVSVKKVPLRIDGKLASMDLFCRNIKYCNDKQSCIHKVNKINEFKVN